MGIELVIGDWKSAKLDASVYGVILQYPTVDGKVNDYADFAKNGIDHF